MIYLLVLLFAILGSLLQGTLLRTWLPPFFAPDPILLLVLYVSLALSFGRGLVLSFTLGLLADILSGAPQGWHALLALLWFVLNKWVLSRVYLKHSPTAFGLFFLDAVLKLLYTALFQLFLGSPLPGIREGISIWGGELFSSFLLMPVLFLLLSKSLGFPGTQFLKSKHTHVT